MKDLKRSLDFYTRVLGFTVLEKLDFKEAKFSLVFLGQCDPKDIPTDPADRVSAFRNFISISAQQQCLCCVMCRHAQFAPCR